MEHYVGTDAYKGMRDSLIESAARNEGVKDDQDKVQMELLSPFWLNQVGQVLTFGARKYAAHNWRKGISRSRLLGAALRHTLAYLGGEDNDRESGLSHLAHASCCLMFLSETHVTHPELDDRYTPPELDDRYKEKKWKARIDFY